MEIKTYTTNSSHLHPTWRPWKSFTTHEKDVFLLLLLLLRALSVGHSFSRPCLPHPTAYHRLGFTHLGLEVLLEEADDDRPEGHEDHEAHGGGEEVEEGGRLADRVDLPSWYFSKNEWVGGGAGAG